MKTTVSFAALILASTMAMAQAVVDTVQQKIEQAQLPTLPDSVKASWNQVDAIRMDFNHGVDSLQEGRQLALRPLEQDRQQIMDEIEQLEMQRKPPGKLKQKLDSLNEKRHKIEDNINSKLDKLKEKTIGKLDKVEMTPEMEGPVKGFASQVNGFKVSGSALTKIAPIEVPGYSLPGNLSELSSIEGLTRLPNLKTPLGDVPGLGQQAGAVTQDVKNIARGNMDEVKQLPKTLEHHGGKLDGISELQKSSETMTGYQEQIKVLKSEDAVKAKGKEMLKKEAVNHFAGKEKELQAAMDKLSKYKHKYSSASSIRNLPKRPPNALKGKPFIERVVPGLWLQFQLREAWLVDLNPYTGYKISGRLMSGIGWNQRFAYSKDDREFQAGKRIFGPRAFFDCKLGRGFVAHLEQEAMNTFVPFNHRGNTEVGNREWVWSTMLGIKKQYKIYKNLHGTVLIQYNLTSQYIKTPYLDRLNSRMGFEYKLKKRSEEKE